MLTRKIITSVLILLASLTLVGCGEKLQLDVKARMDGQPAAEARIVVDGKEIGLAGADGNFSKIIRKKPGADVEVMVVKEQQGYRIQPWKGSFLMKLPKKGVIDTYAFDANMDAMRYVTIVATEAGAPIQDATVRAYRKKAGKTDEKGEFIYEYKKLPRKGVDLRVTKAGYSTWRKKGNVEPGDRLEAALAKQAVVKVVAMREEYGKPSRVRGIKVYINKKRVGRTNSRGVFTYKYDGKPGKKVRLTLSAPGYIPSRWRRRIVLEGQVNIQRYFYPAKPRPIRVGIYRFVSNTPGVDLSAIIKRTEAAVGNNLFKYSSFRAVPSEKLHAAIKRSRLKIDRIITRGWYRTRLRRTVDMIVLGSVAKDGQGYLIETKFYTSSGDLILSQLTRARSEKGIGSAAKQAARSVLEQFPFEGSVVSRDKKKDRYQINLGKTGYRIRRGMDFTIMAARYDDAGRISGFRDIGRLRAKKTMSKGTWTEVDYLKRRERITIGDKVVRRIYREGQDEGMRNYFVLSAKGGLPPDVTSLAGVNIYLNGRWVGSTGTDGKAEVPLRIGKQYNIMLYRHGYQQLSRKIKIATNKSEKPFTLKVNNCLFKVDSSPSRAEVFVDDKKIGKTPISAGKLIPFGFHTVKIVSGGDYRVWEEVLEFDQKVEDRTGRKKIVLHKDYLKIAERSEKKGDYDAAIRAYTLTKKGHPDYSEAHHRLAQLYLDEKGDYDGAIREFESVLSLPENQQLIYKQFAVAFTNLGHAYYEKGNTLVQDDRQEAAQNFAKAIQKLQVAEQNTRFFPTLHYDEAVHDTYYYSALSYHKLYLITRKNMILDKANLAWRKYFDFFPKKLEGKASFEESKESAQTYWNQIKDLM